MVLLRVFSIMAALSTITPVFAVDRVPVPISCNITLENPNSVWNIVQKYGMMAAALRDRGAQWISGTPYAEIFPGGFGCAMMKTNQRTVFTSTFEVESRDDIAFELLADDFSEVQVRRLGSSGVVLFLNSINNYVYQAIDMQPGIYQVTMDLREVGLGATGVVMSVQNSKGKVLLHTEPGQRWQAYQQK